MRRVVLIDGENLVYGLRNLLGGNGNRVSREKLENYDFRGLIEDILADNLPSDILWFGARLRLYDQSPEIKRKSSDAIRYQAKFVNLIQNQKINFIKAGYLRARETDPCEKCSHTTWKLAEKGVDVGLAVRMVQEANDSTEIVVVSADTDLLPAFIAAKKLGANLIHVGYENSPIFALTKASDKTRLVSLATAQRYKK